MIKKFISLKEFSIFIIFASSLSLSYVFITAHSYYVKIKNEERDTYKSVKEKELNAIKLIQSDIIHFDSVNHINDKIDSYMIKNAIELRSEYPNSINLQTILNNIEDSNFVDDTTKLNYLERQAKQLEHHIDSLNISISDAEEQLLIFQRNFDSISPIYTVNFRDSIRVEFTTVNDEIIKSIDANIKDLKISIITTRVSVYFLYILFGFLYPTRWILLLLFTNTNWFEKKT